MIRRVSTLTDIDRSIVGIILRCRAVTPRRKPVAIIEEIITATDQGHMGVMQMIPALIVPFRMIRTEYFVLLTLPVITSFNPMILIEGNRRNLLWLWLRTKVRVLRLDLLHLLRFGLFRLDPRISLRFWLAACRN